jgi:enoyl-CoA hydratase/carnithine racemase
MSGVAHPSLTITLEGGLLDVVLHREPANEIGTAMLADLEALVSFFTESAPSVRAMVLRSSVRRGFSAGADLRELHRANVARKQSGATGADRAREVRAFLDRIHGVMNAIDAAPFTTIAAVHGVVFGGGFELALACDLIVADKSARFCFPELRLGLIPGFGGIPRLRRDVGPAVARDLILTGRSLGAARALELGLVSQLVANDQAPAVARRVAEQSMRFDPRTTRAALEFLTPDLTAELEREKEVFCELFLSPVVDDALARFDADQGAMPYLPSGPEADA